MNIEDPTADLELPPKPTADYLTWPLEKLQREYLTVQLQLSAAKFQLEDEAAETRKLRAFVAALKHVLE